jgi:glycosyltransferase involved in cell wall biosynthesis
MRIGMMADTYKPYISGITNYIDLSKTYLEKLGHEVFVFTFGKSKDYSEESDSQVIRSPGIPLLDSNYYLSLRYTRAAKKALQTMDVVHVHHPFLSGRLALFYCRPAGIPIVFTNHTRYDLYAQVYLPLMPEELSQGLLQAYMPSFCGAVDLVISPSAGMKQVLRDLGVESPIEVIPNGVDLRHFYSAKPISRSEMGYTSEDILLVYSGRLAVEKNLPFLLRCFAGIASLLLNVHLLLIGGGLPQVETELKALVSELGINQRVRFTGLVEYEQLPAYLSMCDVFTTASVSEVHPLSIIEAMAVGLPILGIDSVGVSDTILDGSTGFVSPNNQPAFTARLTKLCMDPSLRTRMSKAAKQASGEFAVERTSKLTLQCYERLLKKPGPKRKNRTSNLRTILERFRT